MLAARRRGDQLQRAGRPTLFALGDVTFTHAEVDEYFRRASEYQPTRSVSSPSQSFIERIEVSTPRTPSAPETSTNNQARQSHEGEDVESELHTPSTTLHNLVSQDLIAPTHYHSSPRFDLGTRGITICSMQLGGEIEVAESVLITFKNYILGSLEAGWYLEGVPMKPTDYRILGSLSRCFVLVALGEKNLAVPLLRNACRTMEDAGLCDYSLFFPLGLLWTFSHFDSQPTLEFRNLFLRHLNNLSAQASSPYVRSYHVLSQKLLQCRNLSQVQSSVDRFIVGLAMPGSIRYTKMPLNSATDPQK